MHITDRRSGNDQKLNLTKALLLYTTGDAAYSGNPGCLSDGPAAITVHDVTCGEIGPGQLLDSALYSDMLRRVGGQGPAQARTILPARILYSGGDRLFWYAPKVRRAIWFKTGLKDFDKAMNGQIVTHPPLLFLASPGRLSVWALGEDKRPEPDTKLFLAPYYNLYNHGGMCAGNVSLPKTLTERDIPAWETYFYDTSFTHSNYGATPVTRYKGGHNRLWQACRFRQEWRPFPAAWLTPARNGNGAGKEILTAGEALNQ